MSRKKKITGYCGLCNSPTFTYRKGKKHKVIVCPKHGVIYSNPLPLLALATGVDFLSQALTGKGALDHVVDFVGKQFGPQEEEYPEEEYYEEDEYYGVEEGDY